MTTETPTTAKRVKLEKQYCFSPVNRRPQQSYFRAFQPSMIVPDRNMTISVIMSKYAGGQHRGLEPQYTDPQMMDMVQGIDARKLSISELHHRIEDNRENIRKMQRNLQFQEQQRLYKEAETAQKIYKEKIINDFKLENKEAPKMH